MPRKQAVDDAIYLDEAEGFLLEHALFSPPRTWPPLHADQPQSARLAASRKKMDWDDEVAQHPDEPIILPPKREDEDANKERCVICLMALRDRTIVGVCGHEFCFECIGVWANQSRRCPLCSADMAPFLLHELDNAVPTKFYLPPLPQRKLPSLSFAGSSRLRIPQEAEQAKEEPDELDLQVERRRSIYQHELYAKHVGSNTLTKFRPNPTPRQLSEDPSLVQRATAFLRRELRVWTLTDVEFLTNHILALLKAVDIRSDPAVRLLSEYLDNPDGPNYPRGAEHFAHELYSFLRSPYKELRKWDEVAQYDPIPLPRSRSRSPSHSRSPSPARNVSRSPSVESRSSRGALRRNWNRRDTFIPPTSPTSRRWDEPDTWLDPDYEAWIEEEKRRESERLARKRRPSMPVRPKRPVELLPSPPEAPLAMDVVVDPLELPEAAPSLSIRGAAKVEPASRLKLVERLARAKAEAETNPIPPLPHSISDPSVSTIGTVLKSSGVRAIVQARLRLRQKLASEKQVFVYNQNETKAQELRRRLLEARARREAEETDAVLRKLDRADRAREIRRRLMVEKMMAAETEVERRQRELKEKLMGERKAKALREKLMQKKRSGMIALEAAATPA
ncbi:hypothetical protein BCR39DRAFT_594419 [Naematelia encephala]|uniref:RING-type E3 ubiquitin transferase n=1 Tax=Naematelia encephala TaxID=71784 RepID=A0A1Y2AYI6_9TREE|nr:hypothetical protein BCR39DRAFT_594419 [Naematelia encephala]